MEAIKGIDEEVNSSSEVKSKSSVSVETAEVGRSSGGMSADEVAKLKAKLEASNVLVVQLKADAKQHKEQLENAFGGSMENHRTEIELEKAHKQVQRLSDQLLAARKGQSAAQEPSVQIIPEQRPSPAALREDAGLKSVQFDSDSQGKLIAN